MGIHLHYCIPFYNIVYLNLQWSGRVMPVAGMQQDGAWISRRFVSVSWWLKVMVCTSSFLWQLYYVPVRYRDGIWSEEITILITCKLLRCILISFLEVSRNFSYFHTGWDLTLNLKILSSQYIQWRSLLNKKSQDWSRIVFTN